MIIEKFNFLLINEKYTKVAVWEMNSSATVFSTIQNYNFSHF